MPYTAISLFSGLGGDSLGLKQAGLNVIGYNEFKSKFCESHQANFPDCELISEGTITDISKLSNDCFLKYKGRTDVIFAGFPCQGFSNAGKKQDNDPRNTLFREFLRATTLIEPSMIIGENVKGLLSKRTEQDGILYIDVIVSEFEKLGYEVKYQVCKTDQFNVPQKRERLIIIGTKKGNKFGWTPKFPKPNKNNPNITNIIKYSMEGSIKVNPDFFAGIPDDCILTDMTDKKKYADNNNAHPYLLSKLNADVEMRTWKNKTYPTLFSFGKRDSPIHCEIVNIKKAAKTILCSYDHQPRFFVPLKNASGIYLRMLLPDELKQIQGFPPEHIVLGTTKEKITQIGNAVPPPLIKAIVEMIIRE